MSARDFISGFGSHTMAALTHPNSEMRGYHRTMMGHMVTSHPHFKKFNEITETAKNIIGSSPEHAKTLMNSARQGKLLSGLQNIATKRNMQGTFDKVVSGMNMDAKGGVNNLAQATAHAKNKGFSGFSLFGKNPKRNNTSKRFSFSNPLFNKGKGGAKKRKTMKRKTMKRKTNKRKTKKNRRN